MPIHLGLLPIIAQKFINNGIISTEELKTIDPEDLN